uniref:Uncharacterized protein n=1 Tax=Parascaris univalens TaxID=6257 RepID=A0A914ZS45_PARUN
FIVLAWGNCLVDFCSLEQVKISSQIQSISRNPITVALSCANMARSIDVQSGSALSCVGKAASSCRNCCWKILERSAAMAFFPTVRAQLCVIVSTCFSSFFSD